MTTLKAAVIGCGAIAHHCHIPGYLAAKNVEIVAVVDPNKKNRDSAKEKFKIPKGYTDADAMLRAEKPDMVSVCSPNRFHADQAIAALQNGCHVLCEKPMCVDAKDVKRIETAVKKSGKLFMMAFTHRTFQGNIKAKKALDRGDIGKPFMIRIRFAHSGPDQGWMMSQSFFTPSQSGGGALFDMGIHAIDLATFFFGKIAKVNGMTGTLVKNIPVEDNAIVQFQFASGALGYAEAGWTTQQGFSGIELYGDQGSIVIDYNDSAYILTGSTTASGKRTLRKKVIEKEPLKGGWPVQMETFIQCVRNNKQPEIGFVAGQHSIQVALAAYESNQKGKTVMI